MIFYSIQHLNCIIAKKWYKNAVFTEAQIGFPVAEFVNYLCRNILKRVENTDLTELN